MRKTWSQHWNFWEIITWIRMIIEKTWNSVFNAHRTSDSLDSHIFIDHKGISKYAQFDSVIWINFIQRWVRAWVWVRAWADLEIHETWSYVSTVECNNWRCFIWILNTQHSNLFIQIILWMVAEGNREQQAERSAPEIFDKINVSERNYWNRAVRASVRRFRECNEVKHWKYHSLEYRIKRCEYRADPDIEERAWPEAEVAICKQWSDNQKRSRAELSRLPAPPTSKTALVKMTYLHVLHQQHSRNMLLRR